jgi:hypothetical protein
MASSKHRTAFVVGALLGASAGVVAAFLNAPQSGRRTRDQIQQAAERVLFKALDIVPFQNQPTDRLATSHPVDEVVITAEPPVDIVIGSRPSEMGMTQTP